MVNPLNTLAKKARLEHLGFTEFKGTDWVYCSEFTATRITPNESPDSPFFINILTEKGETFFVWNTALNHVFETDKLNIEVYKVRKNTFANSSNFLVNLDYQSDNEPIYYLQSNFFQRKSVHLIDQFYDLGDKINIIGNDGMLYTMYEFPSKKILASKENSFYIRSRGEGTVYEKSSEYVGTYNNFMQIDCIHVYPKFSLSK